jgi:hypothetical protein
MSHAVGQITILMILIHFNVFGKLLSESIWDSMGISEASRNIQIIYYLLLKKKTMVSWLNDLNQIEHPNIDA